MSPEPASSGGGGTAITDPINQDEPSPFAGVEIPEDLTGGGPTPESKPPADDPPPASAEDADKAAVAGKQEFDRQDPEKEFGDAKLEDFLKAKDDIPEGVDKVEDKSADNLPPAERQAAAEKLAGRDYSGIDEADLPAFKQMSKEAFAKLKPVYIEHKRVKEELASRDAKIKELQEGVVTIPSSYYEHPQAYTLTPEYNEQMGLANMAGAVESHWRQQLDNIRKGKPWQRLRWDDATKQYVKLEPEAATAESEDFVQDLRRLAFDTKLKAQGAAEQVATQHKAHYTQMLEGIKAAEQKFFPDYQKEDSPLRPMIKQIHSQLPEMIRSSPAGNLLAYSIVRNLQLYDAYKRMKASAATDKAKQSAVELAKAKAGPTAGDINNGGGAKANPREVTIDDFRKAME